MAWDEGSNLGQGPVLREGVGDLRSLACCRQKRGRFNGRLLLEAHRFLI
jgi:hypothetical protein